MDLIERKAVFVSLCEDCMIKYHGECPHPASRCIEYRKINQIPTIEAEPVKHGRWEKSPTGNKYYKYCSECGGCFYMQSKKVIYCPYCGAMMDGGADNEIG